jgi:hypothetical protein
MNHVIFLSVPGLRRQDLYHMPRLAKLASHGEVATLKPSFPAVTWPVQANMLTGKCPSEHGVIANGFYWRESRELEMWTAWNDKILAPQIWDLLHQRDASLTSAVWFPMLSKGCGADYICMPKPVHNPDGTESLWCYTKPGELYGPLRDTYGHFPLKHFWGPLANIKSTEWIAQSAEYAAREFKPRFFYLYLPHLDYAAQKLGPDSPAAQTAVAELDAVLGRMIDSFESIYGAENLTWLVASEYVITPTNHVSYPNRILREANLLQVKLESGGGELIDFENSLAWALVDHQFSHVFVKNFDHNVIDQVAQLFRGREGFAEVLVGDQQAKYRVQHERSGDVILISPPNSWQAYYYWLDDLRAPSFARTVDIHNKPGYDPVELHFDMATKSIPLDATLVKGSHGAPAENDAMKGVLISSRPGVLEDRELEDWDVCGIVMRQFE